MSDGDRQNYLRRVEGARTEEDRQASAAPLAKATAVWPEEPEPIRPNPSVAANWNVGTAPQSAADLLLGVEVRATMADWSRFAAFGRRAGESSIAATFRALLEASGA